MTYLIYYQKKRKPAICHFKEWALHGGMDFSKFQTLTHVY
jgi:hypothetical protein